MHKTLGATSLIAAALVLAPKPSQAATVNAQDLLNDIRADAASIASQADRMNYYSDRGIQVVALDEIKTAVNNMGVKENQLSEMASSLNPIEQHEFYKVAEAGPQIAKDVTAAIGYVNRNPNDLWDGAYRQMTAHLYTDAAGLSHSVDAYSRLYSVQMKQRKLEKNAGTAAD